MVTKARAELRSVTLGLLTRCALAINYCSKTKKACKYFGHLIGLYLVLLFVLQKALGEDLRLNHISKKELLNCSILFVSCILQIVCVCVYVYREREKTKPLGLAQVINSSHWQVDNCHGFNLLQHLGHLSCCSTTKSPA